ncbi:MAG TPA: hypothetical protein PLS29_03770 [Acidimicrobiales bacterium]|nr:MAG: hypothetical protein B7Z69_06160 [Actinobacteria bacterium 21-73-9]HQU26131.1 hypothetical protein [Acidimicrobiales bacterium]
MSTGGRVLVVVVMAVGLVVAAARASASTSAAPVAAPCSAAALSADYTHVDSVQGYGCSGGFGYLWMTVGSGAAEVSVTEVVRYDEGAARWVNAERAYYCVAGRLPAYVERWGCHSN